MTRPLAAAALVLLSATAYAQIPALAKEPLRASAPWTRWWWHGSAVDTATITTLLETYAAAGLGGVEITPIYGVQDNEANELEFLSPAWLDAVAHALAEGNRLGLGVALNLGTGWPYGGPQIDLTTAAKKVELVAGPEGYVAQMLPTLQRVKRAAPGGEGLVFDPFSRAALDAYLTRFDAAFADRQDLYLPQIFNDSFEIYGANWTPNLFAEFQTRRGYDLQAHLATLAGEGDAETSARVRYDYRLTMHELLLSEFVEPWANWCRQRGGRARHQAHGSPGNLLDLYAAADMPETETFGRAGTDILFAKFASSAEHLGSRARCAAETATWLDEHWHVTLPQIKRVADDLFLAGIDHLVFHGTAYSPPEAPWPGRLFYAATQLNPQNPIWRDLPAYTQYLRACQFLLKQGHPTHDILLYYPIHDAWMESGEQLLPTFTAHNTDEWLHGTPFGDAAQYLFDQGIGFDYVSDAQLARLLLEDGYLTNGAHHWRAILMPPCEYLPLATAEKLRALALGGATILWQAPAPKQVPGSGNREAQQAALDVALAPLRDAGKGPASLSFDHGRWRVDADLAALVETLRPGRSGLPARGIYATGNEVNGAHCYFVVNRGDSTFNGWVPLARMEQQTTLFRPSTGQIGSANTRLVDDRHAEVFLQLAPGESIFIAPLAMLHSVQQIAPWLYDCPAGDAQPLNLEWRVTFLEGGPTLPESATMNTGGSWTTLGGAAEAFAGTARYEATLRAENLPPAEAYRIDLGEVAASARVAIGVAPPRALVGPPWTLVVPAEAFADGTTLVVEVTSTAANRIRAMDQQGQPWKIFKDANIVNIDYKPLDASQWPLAPAGLLGPVTVQPYALGGENPEALACP